MRVPARILKWRNSLPEGSIMSKATFARIAREAKRKGYADPKAVAGKAYYRALMAKYREAHGGKMRKNWPQEMTWWDKYKALMTGKHDEENPPFKKPYRVETWFERDRKSIVVYDANDREIAEWWDEDVDGMVEDGYFDASGFIMGREVRRGRLEDSVLAYVKEMGLDMPKGLDRAAKMRRAAAKRQGKNPPELTSAERILLSAFKSHDRLTMRDIPGHYAESLAVLMGKGLVRSAGKQVWELTPAGRTHRNPPLPASALVELTTARTITREVGDGTMPVSRLREAANLQETALVKLRSSHAGHIDFSNPPHREIYRDLVEIKATKSDGKHYVHKFGKGSCIYGLPDGSLHIVSRDGKRLWKNFSVEG